MKVLNSQWKAVPSQWHCEVVRGVRRYGKKGIGMSKTVKELKLSNGDQMWLVTDWPSNSIEVILKPTVPLTDDDEVAIGKALRQIADAAVVGE
jgi:hypothetical protein